MTQTTIAIIGGGPAGLMAADILSSQGFTVAIYERKPSAGRKFLMAGRGGLNLTHSEGLESFIEKYGSRSKILDHIIKNFSPQDLRNWCEALGQKTFVGSSGRVFPDSFKASPLLRAWMARLEDQGVQFFFNHDWQGWDANDLIFRTRTAVVKVQSSAVLLALGGASWPRLGSDGSWVDLIKGEGAAVSPLRPSNCGFTVAWSDVFSGKYAGQPLKPVVVSFNDTHVQGEVMITRHGIEGGCVYALSSALREEIDQKGSAKILLDLKPGLDLNTIAQRLQRRRRDTLSNYLRKTIHLSPPAIGLMLEVPDRKERQAAPPKNLAELIKNYPLLLTGSFSLDRAISSAGGVTFESLDSNFMMLTRPGVFIAGEMMDWEAPTGGYLLQATFATAVHAARGIARWLENHER